MVDGWQERATKSLAQPQRHLRPQEVPPGLCLLSVSRWWKNHVWDRTATAVASVVDCAVPCVAPKLIFVRWKNRSWPVFLFSFGKTHRRVVMNNQDWMMLLFKWFICRMSCIDNTWMQAAMCFLITQSSVGLNSSNLTCNRFVIGRFWLKYGSVLSKRCWSCILCDNLKQCFIVDVYRYSRPCSVEFDLFDPPTDHIYQRVMLSFSDFCPLFRQRYSFSYSFCCILNYRTQILTK